MKKRIPQPLKSPRFPKKLIAASPNRNRLKTVPSLLATLIAEGMTEKEIESAWQKRCEDARIRNFDNCYYPQLSKFLAGDANDLQSCRALVAKARTKQAKLKADKLRLEACAQADRQSNLNAAQSQSPEAEKIETKRTRLCAELAQVTLRQDTRRAEELRTELARITKVR